MSGGPNLWVDRGEERDEQVGGDRPLCPNQLTSKKEEGGRSISSPGESFLIHPPLDPSSQNTKKHASPHRMGRLRRSTKTILD